MTDDEYTSRFLELLTYVPYLTEEKSKIQRFISGLLVAFKDRIEFDETRSLEEAIQKLRHFYEQSKHITETNQIGEVMQRTKANGTEREQRLKIKVTRRMSHQLRGSMH